MFKHIWRFILELYSDSFNGRARLSKFLTTLLFITTIYIEVYVIRSKDCAYALEFVISNLSFISISLGINAFSSIKTKQLNMAHTNTQDCNSAQNVSN